MKNSKWYAAVLLAALMALPGAASAHDMDKGMDKGGAGHHHHRHHPMMCKPGDFKQDKADFEKMHALHEKLHAVLAASAFDKKAFLSLSGQMDKLRGQIAKRHAEAFANMAAKLSPEQREKMMRGFHMHEHGEGDWHEHGDAGWRHHGEWPHNNNNQTHDWTPPSAR